MTDPRIIDYIKKDLRERVAKGDNQVAQRMGFGGGFSTNQSVLVFWGKIVGEDVEGRTMEQNLQMANLSYSESGFMAYAMARLAQNDVYAVIKIEDNQEPKLLLIKKAGL